MIENQKEYRVIDSGLHSTKKNPSLNHPCRIALVENFGSDFVGARLRFALFLKEKGASVTAIIPSDGHSKIIEEHSISVIEVNSNIRDKNVLKIWSYARQLRRILKEENFDIVHFYRFQPNIIGTFVAGIATKSKIVNHVTGLGLAFTSKSWKNIFLQNLTKFLYAFNGFWFKPYFICQNEQDMIDLKLGDMAVCIKGSSVNESRFTKNFDNSGNQYLNSELNISNRQNTRVFLFVSRLLKEKGVLELIEGFKRASDASEHDIRLALVGWSDPENPSSISITELEAAILNRKDILYLGKRSDVDKLIAFSDVSILPTYYREGVPRFLLESMAMGKPIITTRMPGCKDLVENGANGELIEIKSADAISSAVLKIMNRDLKQMGEKSWQIYHSKYSEKKVYSSILELYNKILD